MPVALYPTIAGLGVGSPDEPLDGSGLAISTGVEGVYEFNGLQMNVRDWWDTILIQTISGVDDADIRDAREVNPARHGETAFQALYGGRTITLDGKIRAHSLRKLRDIQQAIRTAFGDLEEHPLIIQTGISSKSVQIMCKKHQKINMPETQADFRFWRDFQISLRASDPFFRSRIENIRSLEFSPGETVSDILFNDGTFAANPRLRLVGPLKDPIVSNISNGTSVELAATLASGEVWDIDTQKSSVVDQYGANRFNDLSIENDIMSFSPGPNNVQASASAGVVPSTGTVQIFWRDTWT